MTSGRPAAAEYEPDIAARTALLSAVLWVVAASGVGVLVQARLLWPDVLDSQFLSYGRLRPVHDTFLVFGWLTMAGFAAIFAILPRLANIRLHNEVLGSTSAVWWSISLFAGAATLLLGMNQGRPLAELPIGVDALLVLLAVTVAYNAIMTVSRRRERTLYVSAWYLLAAVAWLPILYAIGNVPVLSGVLDAIVSGFYQNGIELLWLAPLSLAVAYYLVPEVTGRPMHSRQLALVGFWALAFVGGWAGQRYGVLGPGPDGLETIGIAMTVVLLVPTLSAVTSLFATGRGMWALVAEDVGLRFVAVGLGSLVVWIALVAVSSFRSVARTVGLTTWDAGVRHLGLYGVFSAFAFGFVYCMYPRLVGRSWHSKGLASFHFWGTVGGVAVGGLAMLGGGLVQSGMRIVFAQNMDASGVGTVAQQAVLAMRGWQMVQLLAALVVAAAQLTLAWNVYRTSRSGEPLAATLAVPVGVGSGA